MTRFLVSLPAAESIGKGKNQAKALEHNKLLLQLDATKILAQKSNYGGKKEHEICKEKA